jgi:hypothetical protein
MEIQFFNSIFFWKKYFKDLLKIFIIELKEKFHHNYLKLIILYPGLCSILLIIGINILFGVSDVQPQAELVVSFCTSTVQTYMSTALSLASFEPNPEYLYLYRLERKIELINTLIHKIEDKNPTHLNLDFKNTKFVIVENYMQAAVDHHSRLYLEFAYPAKFPLATDVIKFNSSERQKIFIDLLETMSGRGSVKKKFDLALKTITVEGLPMLDKTTKAKYDCKLLFDPYVIKGQTRDLRGLITFSEGFRNYSYVDLCALDFYIGLIAWALVLHYWILPEDINIVGKVSLNLIGEGIYDYSILINGGDFNANIKLWERSKNLPDLVRVLLEMYLEAMIKEDSYRLAIISDALMFRGRILNPPHPYYLNYTNTLMTIVSKHLFNHAILTNIETYFFFPMTTVVQMLIHDLTLFIFHGR